MTFDDEKLFFIIGVGRSGTSILQEILNTFSGFCNKKESKIGGPHSMTCWTSIRKSNDFSFLQKFISENWTDEYFVEKTPDSILCLPQLLEKFSNANYIFLERCPYDIILSQLNMYNQPSDDFLERQYHLVNHISKKDNFFLTPEQYWSKLTCSQIELMKKYQEKFSKRIILRYEVFINSWQEQLELIAQKFSLKKNIDKAEFFLKKPSYSSKNNKYEIKTITDPIALKMIHNASELLGYKIKK